MELSRTRNTHPENGSVRLELVPLAAQVSHADARRRWDSRTGVMLVVRFDGTVGLGEASPLLGVSPDDLEASLLSLRALGSTVQLPLALGALTTDPRLASLPPAARMGLETALLDLIAQREGVPLFKLLAGSSAVPERLDTQWLVRPDVDLYTVEQALRDGARAFKLKVGAVGERERDVVRLTELRALAPGALLRVDANESGVSAGLATALEASCVDVCEDPWPLSELLSRPRPRFGVALDSAVVRDATGALAAAAEGRAAALVFKPTALGGLLRTRRLAQRALACGARAIISHALESPIALAASAHLALALGASETHGLARYDGLERFRAADVPLDAPEWLGAFEVVRPVAPGLGVSLRG